MKQLTICDTTLYLNILFLVVAITECQRQSQGTSMIYAYERGRPFYCTFGTLEAVQAQNGAVQPECYRRHTNMVFYLDDGTQTYPFLKDGVPGGFVLTCPSLVAHGKLNDECNHLVHSTCTVTCASGYTAVGDDPLTLSMTCDLQEPWTNVSVGWSHPQPCVSAGTVTPTEAVLISKDVSLTNDEKANKSDAYVTTTSVEESGTYGFKPWIIKLLGILGMTCLVCLLVLIGYVCRGSLPCRSDSVGSLKEELRPMMPLKPTAVKPLPQGPDSLPPHSRLSPPLSPLSERPIPHSLPSHSNPPLSLPAEGPLSPSPPSEGPLPLAPPLSVLLSPPSEGHLPPSPLPSPPSTPSSEGPLPSSPPLSVPPSSPSEAPLPPSPPLSVPPSPPFSVPLSPPYEGPLSPTPPLSPCEEPLSLQMPFPPLAPSLDSAPTHNTLPQKDENLLSPPNDIDNHSLPSISLSDLAENLLPSPKTGYPQGFSDKHFNSYPSQPNHCEIFHQAGGISRSFDDSAYGEAYQNVRNLAVPSMTDYSGHLKEDRICDGSQEKKSHHVPSKPFNMPRCDTNVKKLKSVALCNLEDLRVEMEPQAKRSPLITLEGYVTQTPEQLQRLGFQSYSHYELKRNKYQADVSKYFTDYLLDQMAAHGDTIPNLLDYFQHHNTVLKDLILEVHKCDSCTQRYTS